MDRLLDSVLSSTTLLQWTVVILAFSILLWPKKSAQKSSGKFLPPSPRGLPVIGHLHLFGSLLHHSQLHELSKLYGDLVFLRFGSIPMLVVSSREMAREVLQTHDAAFASRPSRVAGDYFLYNTRDIALSPNNQYWKTTRKLCATELFTARRLASFTGIIRDEVGELCSELLKAHQDNKVVNMRSSLSAFSFNIVTRILMRKAYLGPKATDSSSPKEATEFVNFMQDVPKAVSTVCLADAFPSLAWFKPEILFWRNIRRRIDAFLDKVLLDHQVKRDSEDFMDLLIAHFGWGAVTDIKAVTLDLLAAGTDTSTSTIEWALAALLHNPELFEKARAELDNVVGPGRMVEESDIQHLQFMNAVIKETFRLYPPVPLLLPHACEKAPGKLGGYDIPEGTTVVVNAYSIGRDEKVWENAEDFNPERFIGSNINVYGSDFELLPFGSGRRRCPGIMLAMKTVLLGLSNLVHGFEWSFPNGVTAENHKMVGLSGLVHFLETPLIFCLFFFIRSFAPSAF